MTTIAAQGLSADLPSGWDGEIYVRAAVAAQAPSGETVQAGVAHPVMQLADFALPATRGDFGGGAVELMGPRNVFATLFEHGTESVGTPLFADTSLPWPVAPGDFGPNRLQRPLPGQAGAQWFFTVQDRAFCLYAVLGSYTLRALLARQLNRTLSTIRITPR